MESEEPPDAASGFDYKNGNFEMIKTNLSLTNWTTWSRCRLLADGGEHLFRCLPFHSGFPQAGSSISLRSCPHPGILFPVHLVIRLTAPNSHGPLCSSFLTIPWSSSCSDSRDYVSFRHSNIPSLSVWACSTFSPVSRPTILTTKLNNFPSLYPAWLRKGNKTQPAPSPPTKTRSRE